MHPEEFAKKKNTQNQQQTQLASSLQKPNKPQVFQLTLKLVHCRRGFKNSTQKLPEETIPEVAVFILKPEVFVVSRLKKKQHSTLNQITRTTVRKTQEKKKTT